MAVFPEMPPQLRDSFPAFFWSWWQAFKGFVTSGFETAGDVRLTAAGKGTVLTNAAGTVTKRIRLNDLGDGIIIEDV